VQFQLSSLHCCGNSVDLQSLVKIKGVPWLLLSNLTKDDGFETCDK
jgi:hypothetical protein